MKSKKPPIDIQWILLIFIILLFFVLFIGSFFNIRFFRLGRKIKTKVSGSESFFENINTKKHTLKRYISRLEKQIEERKRQLKYHEDTEEAVTTRLNLLNKDSQDINKADEEWTKIMKRGREIYGDKWNNPDTPDGISLRKMMLIYKDDLLSIKNKLKDNKNATFYRKELDEKNLKKAIEEQNKTLLKSKHEEFIKLQNSQLLLTATTKGSQWKSIRQTAESTKSKNKYHTSITPLNDFSNNDSKIEINMEDDSSYWKKRYLENNDKSRPSSIVPKLDLSRLSI